MTRTLSQRELNRAVLARQLLLERAGSSLPKTLERVAGIQAQYAPSMYVGLWSRLGGFERDQLTRALERRTVIQATLMRMTIHLVSRGDYWPFAIAVRKARREWWLRTVKTASEKELERAAERVRERLREGSAPRAELESVAGKAFFGGVGLWLDMVRVPPSGTWDRRRADIYASAEEWIGPEPALSEDDAMTHLVRRYLAGFGPASRKDVATYTGIHMSRISPIIDDVAPRRFHAEDGTELVDVARAPLPDAETPAPVRFLPTWDSTLLAHARRTQILTERHRPLVFHTKNPQSLATFLVDGAVAGSWRYEDGSIALQPFEKLPRNALREVREEADRLAELHR